MPNHFDFRSDFQSLAESSARRAALNTSSIIGGQLAGVGVLPARVVAADQMRPVGSRCDRAVRERGRGRDTTPAPLEQLQIGVEPDPPERDDDPDAGKRVDLGVEVRQAVGDFFGRRLVVGRRAADGGGDERVARASGRRRRAARSGCSRSRRDGARPSGSRPSRRRRRR